MALKDKKQLQNILTGVVVALALILLLVVILVKTGVFNSSEKTTAEETVIDTAVVIASETQENGEVTYYTVSPATRDPRSRQITFTRPKRLPLTPRPSLMLK